MSSFLSYSKTTNLQFVRAIAIEPFEEVARVIIEGRYFWPCV